jgi:1-phosphofructokinase family hexose kinase
MISCLGLSPSLDVTYRVPVLRAGEIHRPEWRLALPGGKSLNVARAARLLGGQVRAIVPLGGFTGDEIQRMLEETDLAVEVVATREPTRSCLSVVDDADGGITEFYERVPELDDDAWRAVVASLRGVVSGWLVVSGSVPVSRAGELGAALATAAERGVRLALDLRGEALDAVLAITRPALVKVNRAEAEEAVGAADLAELARRLRTRGAQIAVVTDGAAGSLGADADGGWRVTTTPAGPYTVGAGDCFLAALVLALDARSSLRDALGRASAVAAANTLHPGAARFEPRDADRLASGIEVRPW